MAPQITGQPVSGTLDTGYAPGSAVLYSSAARTATPAAVVFTPGDQREILSVTIKTSAAGSSPSTVPTVEYYDPASDSWIALLAGAAITGTGTIELSVGPHAVETTNLSHPCALAQYLRVVMTHGNATSHTYSIGVRAS